MGIADLYPQLHVKGICLGLPEDEESTLNIQRELSPCVAASVSASIGP